MSLGALWECDLGWGSVMGCCAGPRRQLAQPGGHVHSRPSPEQSLEKDRV